MRRTNRDAGALTYRTDTARPLVNPTLAARRRRDEDCPQARAAKFSVVRMVGRKLPLPVMSLSRVEMRLSREPPPASVLHLSREEQRIGMQPVWHHEAALPRQDPLETGAMLRS